MKFFKVFLTVLLLAAAVASCRKDDAVNLTVEKTNRIDSSSSTGNYLAVKGSLNVIVGDSTYTFDAAKDSIAFINVNIDSNKYFGITAINKEHTLSFGVSSPGFAVSDLSNNIAGGQLLFSGKHTQYALASNPEADKANQISLEQYMKDSTISKGTFSMLMVNKVGKDSTLVRAKGNFNLQK